MSHGAKFGIAKINYGIIRKQQMDWLVDLSFRGGASARKGEIHKRNCGGICDDSFRMKSGSEPRTCGDIDENVVIC